MSKKENKSFWAIVGVFIILSGITTLAGDSLGWLGDRLFPLFLISVGGSIVVNLARGYMTEGTGI